MNLARPKQARRNRNGYCRICNENGIGKKRAAYGHLICKACGEVKAKAERKNWCVAPMHKSNYMLITNPLDLLGINQKGGLVK
jgi:hypothetical protein